MSSIFVPLQVIPGAKDHSTMVAKTMLAYPDQTRPDQTRLDQTRPDHYKKMLHRSFACFQGLFVGSLHVATFPSKWFARAQRFRPPWLAVPVAVLAVINGRFSYTASSIMASSSRTAMIAGRSGRTLLGQRNLSFALLMSLLQRHMGCVPFT